MPPKKRTRKEADLEGEYESYTNEQLRDALKNAGKNPGPIDAANRKLYINMLIKTQTTTETDTTTPSPVVLLSSPEKGYKKSKIASGSSSPLMRTPLVATRKLPSPSFSYSPTLTAEPKQKGFDVTKIEGLTAATFTPFASDGEVNLRVIRGYADFLLKQGVRSVFVNGTTGEGVSLTDEERKLVAEEWLKVAGKRMTVIIHVGSMSLKSTCDLAMHAEQNGAAAIGAMPPSYIKPPSLDSLVLYLQKVGEAAPNTPLFYYHIPVLTGVKFSMEDLLKAAVTDIPTLRGLKYTDEDMMEFTRCLACEKGSFPIMYGRDEQLLASLAMGGSSAIGTTYNYCGLLNNRLLKYFKEGDLKSALREQRRSDDAIMILRKYASIAGVVGAAKAILKARGFDVGPPRLPLLPLSVEDYGSLVTDLKSIGFFDWA
ncbi:PREDICTED: N-acetylneuraminate lyase B-like isoform X4 [Amphimedon queenslandica]|uniref:N-acetylneuraminate lyase n=1 Tax=Amphimedon queenslandica TaxID=400682 RepID=A0AAN0JA77_AMPQE|nr:PREDICTED: N-acetylneuraminate lyase B-like isoform X4 [Amphimedon queenslandica]|eukprot:XP_019853657.1 PREDICTED: N-acetylneuraminate lyase B-like isoform X4 [Amphimedon queenslandica]